MKAIVLTYAPITDKEEELLKNTDVFKIACNWHAEELHPHKRIVLDSKETIKKALAVGEQEIISGNYDYDDPRVKRVYNLPNRHSTLISACDYLIFKGYTDILLIANNQMTNHKEISNSFQKLNKNGINTLKDYARIYKYCDNAVFDVKTKTIEEFLTMTDENLILGTTENDRENPLLKGLIFTDAYLFKVQTKGYDNPSITNGRKLSFILPLEKQQEILSGAIAIEYNGLEITRITGVEQPEKEEKKEEAQKKEIKKTIKKTVKRTIKKGTK